MKNNQLPSRLVLVEINNLAATLFAMHGKTVREGVKFYAVSCELGRQCWNAAVVTYFNTVIQNSGIPISQYLLPKFQKNAGTGVPSTQPLVYY